MCLYQKFISRFTHTLIIVPGCFLIFSFRIKGNQVYYTCITYIPVLLVSTELFVLSLWNMAKYGLSVIRILPYVDIIVSVFSSIWNIQIRIRGNTDTILCRYGKIRIRESSHIFIHNLDLRESISFVNTRKLFVRKCMNCLTVWKWIARK